MNALERIHACGVVPVVVLDRAEDAVPTARALLEGGVNVMEITFRTAAAEESIRRVAESCPEMLVGAGTVLSPEQCARAIDAGAKFIVSPGFSDEVAAICRWENVTYYPGCVTPTEIMHAIDEGFEIVKFFPAGIYGGLAAIKTLAAPFPQVKFIPTGGVSLSNLAEFLSCDRVFAVGGSFMMKGDITENCKEIVKICGSLHSEK